MRAAPGLPVVGAAGALLVVALFFGEGSSDGRLFWIGAFAILAALAALIATFAGIGPRPAPSRAGMAALALFAALVVWVGVTMAWSLAADRSWAYLDRSLVYLAFAVLGVYVGTLVDRPARTTAAVLAALLGGVFCWALLGKVFPGLFPDGARVARLRDPVGYWNALALLAAVSLPLALWLAAGRRHAKAFRAGGVLLLYLGEVALVLTYSRAGFVVAALGVCLWLALTCDRFEGLAMLIAGSVPAAVVGAWASTQDSLVEDLQTRAARDRAGAWFALALVLGAAAALGLSHLAVQRGDRLPDAERSRWAIRLGVGIVVAVVAGVLVASVAVGGPGKWLDEFRGSSEVVQGSGRLGELSSNNRWTWWKEAWSIFEDNPAGGTGAHTFEIARRPIRVGSIVTTEPHNIGVQFLSETGVLGLLLGLGAVVASGVACAEAFRRLEGEERAAACCARRGATGLPPAHARGHRLGLRRGVGAGLLRRRRPPHRGPRAGGGAGPTGACDRGSGRRARGALLADRAVAGRAEGRRRLRGARPRRRPRRDRRRTPGARPQPAVRRPAGRVGADGGVGRPRGRGAPALP